MRFANQNVYRATLDTNVFVSGGTITESPPSQVIDRWRNREFELVASPQLIAEYQEVLLRPKVLRRTGLSLEETQSFVEQIQKRAYTTSGNHTLTVLKADPDDNMVLACAEEGFATHLVTGNIRHYPFTKYKNIFIVTPREFLSLLDSHL